MNSGKVKRVFDIQGQVPYAYNSTTLYWVGYDDPVSVANKVGDYYCVFLDY